MKTNAIIRIILWSIVILVLLTLLVSVLSFSSHSAVVFTDSTEVPMDVLSGEETLLISPEIRELDIEWVSGSILIQPADVEQITISESNVSDEKYAMLYQTRDGKLSIQFCKETATLSILSINTTIRKDLTIFVPRNWTCDSLEIDTASADVEVNDLTIRDVEFDGASGVCKFENCTVDTIDMDTASGDIRFSGSLNILDFDGASANISAVLTNTPTRMDMDTMSGDLELTLPEDTGFAVSMDTLSGHFSSDFETTMANGSHVHGDGACRISISAMSGDVSILKNGNATVSHHEHDESCYAADSTCPDYSHHEHDESCYAADSTCTEKDHH